MTALDQKAEAARRILAEAVRERFPGRIALVSSFGADSAVLLHLAASVDRALPVLFIETLRHFPETLAYRTDLARHLGLTNLRDVRPDAQELREQDPDETRAVWDPDGCCGLRKVAPLERALAPFEAWITGRKRHQTADREKMPVIERDGARTKINPLATWTADDIAAYARRHRLPAHPLVARGYPSIGCAPCTATASAGAPRAGRWAGTAKTECGLHARPLPETI